MRRFDVVAFGVFLAISLVLAGVLKWLSGLPFWAAWAIGAVGVWVNAWLLDWEDRQPPGPTNPL